MTSTTLSTDGRPELARIRPAGRGDHHAGRQVELAPVRLGAMCEPPNGVPEMPSLLAALGGLDVDLFAIVEQDLYPCDLDVPLPIATRTRRYLGACGLGPTSAR